MATGVHLSPILADGVSKERLIAFVVIVLAVHTGVIWLLKPQPKAQEIRKPANLMIELGKALPAAPAAEAQEAPEPARPEAVKPAPPPKKLPVPAAPPKTTAPVNPSQTSPAESTAARQERAAPAELAPTAPAAAATNATRSEPTEPAAQATPKTLTESVRTAEPDYKAAYLNNPRPPYPRNAHRFGIEGTVVLQAEVNEDGVPLQVRIFQSSGNDLLDESALSTVSKWRFSPARKDGVMVRAFVKIPITFSLRSPAQR